MSGKIGFWPMLSIVMGAQIGSSVLMAPTTLAPFGIFGALGWIISGAGAVFLALVFASLSMKFDKTGGPHIFVLESFGKTTSFFVAWTYFVMSFISTTVVITACVGYLKSVFTFDLHSIFLELFVLGLITFINLRGIKSAGYVEFILSNIKVIPLIILPIAALFFFDFSNFSTTDHLPTTNILSSVITLTLWGFVGLEAGTVPAGSVENPRKVIPKAVVIGTFLVGCIYVLNSLGIMGAVSFQTLINSSAPYSDATQILFGGKSSIIISIFASIICLGTINAWVLTSGQIGFGASLSGLFPKAFSRTNKQGAPYFSLLFSSIGIVPFLILTSNSSLTERIYSIIELSVTALVFVYAMCVACYLKTAKSSKEFLIGLGAAIFCVLVIVLTPVYSLFLSSFFVLSGIPIFIFMKNK